MRKRRPSEQVQVSLNDAVTYAQRAPRKRDSIVRAGVDSTVLDGRVTRSGVPCESESAAAIQKAAVAAVITNTSSTPDEPR